MHRILVALSLCALAACGGAPCDADNMSAGDVSATVDGDAWSGSGATWSAAGDAIQLTTADSDGWRLTLVASSTIDGDPVAEVLVDGATAEVELGDGSFIAAYPTGVAGSYAANESGTGELFLERVGDEILACFSMEGTASDDSTVSMSDGALRASCVGCE